MKNKGLPLIIGTIVVTLLLGSSMYFIGKPKAKPKGTNWKTEQEIRFREDVNILDTLYRSYKNQLSGVDKALFVITKGELQKQLTSFQEKYCSTQSVPSLVASKVLNNYYYILKLNDELASNNKQIDLFKNNLKTEIEQLEKINQNLTIQNQTLNQQLIMLP